MPYSPSCLERLSGKCPKASQRRVFGSEKGPNSGSFSLLATPGTSIRAPFRVSRQSLEQEFCEVRAAPVLCCVGSLYMDKDISPEDGVPFSTRVTIKLPYPLRRGKPMATLYCPCAEAHKLWGEFWWAQGQYRWVFFDDAKTSETYAEQVEN